MPAWQLLAPPLLPALAEANFGSRALNGMRQAAATITSASAIAQTIALAATAISHLLLDATFAVHATE